MPEIGTSGLMSGDGKRGDGLRPPSYRAHPRLYLNGHTPYPASLDDVVGEREHRRGERYSLGTGDLSIYGKPERYRPLNRKN